MKSRFFVFLTILAIGSGQATAAPMDRLPQIFPDYTDITLPPNIAPLNFVIQETGQAFKLSITPSQGPPLIVDSRSDLIRIPPQAWRSLLQQNLGQTTEWEISIQDLQGQWHRFKPFTNTIARDPINSHLVYRCMQPTYQYLGSMGLYQRDLTTTHEQILADNQSMGQNCMNCHCFHNYRPDRMIFHMRTGEIGTCMMQVYDGQISKIDTHTEFNPPTAYRSWHPNGELIAFSYNKVKQIFHAVGDNRDVYDRSSDLVLYDVTTQVITTDPKISDPNIMETYPEWSADGHYLYFCSAPGLQEYETDEHPYKKIHYNLQRISYDVQTGHWGDIETVFDASSLGLSVAHPKVSPDGRFLVFCVSQYSNFPLYNRDGDLYLLNLATQKARPIEPLNSPQSESYHCFSSNSRWLVFSSKRLNKLCTHPFFAYLDQEGHFTKPFILPQKDPRIYRERFTVYNVPEFINGPITLRPQSLLSTAWSNKIKKATFKSNK